MAELTLFEITYILTNVLHIYICRRFIKIFLEDLKYSNKAEWLVDITYFVVITVVYLGVGIPILTLITNLVMMAFITALYEGSMKKKIMAILYTYLILACVELVVVLLMYPVTISVFEVTEFDSSVALIAVKVVSYMVLNAVEKYRYIKEGEELPNSYWIALLGIPIGCLYLLLSTLQINGTRQGVLTLNISVILGIVVSIFFLYDELILSLKHEKEKELLKQQNEHYNMHFNALKDSYDATRSLKHDLKNHLCSLYLLVQQGEDARVLEYISQMSDGIEETIGSYSGNNDIDSIINCKIKEAKEKQVELDAEVEIDGNLVVNSFDLTTVLGNLIDNAITAAAKLEEEKEVYIEITTLEDKLMIMVKNSYDGQVKCVGGKFITTKKQSDNHGLGLLNVEKVVDKYNGEIEISYCDNIFVVNITMKAS